jgi:diguanylate cyclase (GGDEF)-like protein
MMTNSGDCFDNKSILIIDDARAMRQQIGEILRHADLGVSCYEAKDGLEGLKLMLAMQFDVILCDLEMPGMDGLKFLRAAGSRSECRETPIILLTSHDDLATKVRCLENGASDYITKPFAPEELVARVKIHLKIKSLQDDLRQSNRRLQELSSTDSLTGLDNRRQMMETLNREFGRCRRTGNPFALLMVDLDHFKSVNDNYGHQNGDIVLQHVARQLQIQLRQYDTAARYGGEEFVLLLPETNVETACGVAERLCRQIASCALPLPMADLSLTISIGVAVAPHPMISEAQGLIQYADSALYAAKEKGRNRVEIFQSDSLSAPLRSKNSPERPASSCS